MEKIFHWTNTFKTLGEDEDGSIKISGLASTNALDRTGDVINHDAWTKSNGLENFGIEEETPDLFDSNNNEVSEPNEESNSSEEDEFEIPAFLRRQKN